MLVAHERERISRVGGEGAGDSFMGDGRWDVSLIG